MFKRAMNYTDKELEILISSLEQNPEIVTGRLGGMFRTAEDVRKAWDKIAEDMCITCMVAERTGQELKSKWTDLKYRVKKKIEKIAILESEANVSCNVSLTSIEKRANALIQHIPHTSKNSPLSVDLTFQADQNQSITVQQMLPDVTYDYILQEMNKSNDAIVVLNTVKEEPVSPPSTTSDVQEVPAIREKQTEEMYTDKEKVQILKALVRTYGEYAKTTEKAHQKFFESIENVMQLQRSSLETGMKLYQAIEQVPRLLEGKNIQDEPQELEIIQELQETVFSKELSSPIPVSNLHSQNNSIQREKEDIEPPSKKICVDKNVNKSDESDTSFVSSVLEVFKKLSQDKKTYLKSQMKELINKIVYNTESSHT